MTIRFGNISAASTVTASLPRGAALVSAGGLGSMALQNSTGVSITGGSIAGTCVASSAFSSTAVTIAGGTIANTPIGATAASSANFTALAVSSAATFVSVLATSSISGSSGGVTNTWAANTVAATSNLTGNHLGVTSGVTGSSADFTNGLAASSAAFTNGMSASSGAFSAGVAITSAVSASSAAITNTARIGVVVVTSGLLDASSTNSGQIKFPATQNASAEANTLDDYEEGTFTPTLSGATTTTYTERVATYVKIGRYVWFQVDMTINLVGDGSTSVVALGALPTAAQFSAVSVSYFTGLATNVVWLFGYVNTSASPTVNFQSLTVAAAASGTNAIFTNGTRVIFAGAYQV